MKYKLKNLIFKASKSQWQICQELNWPEAKFSRFVTGRRIPSRGEIEELAQILNVSPAELQEAIK